MVQLRSIGKPLFGARGVIASNSLVELCRWPQNKTTQASFSSLIICCVHQDPYHELISIRHSGIMDMMFCLESIWMPKLFNFFFSFDKVFNLGLLTCWHVFSANCIIHTCV